MTLAAGPVWTFWIAVPLAAMAVIVLIATIVGYATNVSSSRYPKGEE